MDSSKILIYDKTDYLVKLVKHYCGRNSDLLFHNDKQTIDLKTIKKLDIAYIKTEDLNDIEDILIIHNKSKKVYIDTNSKIIISEIVKLNKTFLFNSKNDKYEIMCNIFNNTLN